jgi:alpha-glucosidase (family GH31 glycosyl hydrolase)
MYVRWVQLGAFQPLDRLHSHHGQRLPWEYPAPAASIAAEFLRLRGSLVPYLYTLAREAHDRGLPIARAMYLQWPRRSAAYRHPTQYTLGRDVLVAPVADPGDPAETTVWFPPGTWIDWFTGERHRGPGAVQLSVPLERMPVFVRAGGIVPTLPPLDTTPAGTLKRLVLTAYRGSGRLRLYDDAGEGLAYERGAFSRTTISQRRTRGRTVVTIGRARGELAPTRRVYELRLVGVPRPGSVTVVTKRLATNRTARIVVR